MYPPNVPTMLNSCPSKGYGPLFGVSFAQEGTRPKRDSHAGHMNKYCPTQASTYVNLMRQVALSRISVLLFFFRSWLDQDAPQALVPDDDDDALPPPLPLAPPELLLKFCFPRE